MVSMPEPIMQAIPIIAERWGHLDVPWRIGGSCGLLLHGVPIRTTPRDLDIYVDAQHSAELHRALLPFAVDEPSGSETALYRSILSHYRIGDVAMELVAGFEVRADGACYRIRIAGEWSRFALRTAVGGVSVEVMPLAHELLFNMLRSRPDRYEPIAEAMRSALPKHLPALRALLSTNRFDRTWVDRVSAVLLLPASELVPFPEEPACRT